MDKALVIPETEICGRVDVSVNRCESNNTFGFCVVQVIIWGSEESGGVFNVLLIS